MTTHREVEIKFRTSSIAALSRKLRASGFRLLTKRTLETNTLYDLPGGDLRSRGALLRLRKYGPTWTVTYKDRSRSGRHKSRREIETTVGEGETLVEMFQALGLGPRFSYEKFRTEWSKGAGHVLIDETPIGDFGEIEGPPRWIDAVAKQLDIGRDQYITASYSELFQEWKEQTGSRARDLLFSEVTRTSRRPSRSR